MRASAGRRPVARERFPGNEERSNGRRPGYVRRWDHRTANSRIHLLGQPRFTLFGQPHRFSAPPRTLPLLAYLLLHRNAHLTRQSVALALWPDDSEEAARTNLRRHLHHLKEALPSLDTPWFVADGETLRWQADSQASFDVELFERRIAAGELDEAVAIYAGDLLPSLYDDWIVADRERLRALYNGALETLLVRARSRREFALASEYAHRILLEDPWREDRLRQLMSIRYESGDRTGALRDFETFAQRLQSELNAEPMAETIALREIILLWELAGTSPLFGITEAFPPGGWRAPVALCGSRP